MILPIWELNRRALLLYAEKAVGTKPGERPALADRVFLQVAQEFALSEIITIRNEAYAVTIWEDAAGNLVNCWMKTPQARYRNDYYEGIGFDDNTGQFAIWE
jgi:hypothetical protein